MQGSKNEGCAESDADYVPIFVKDSVYHLWIDEHEDCKEHDRVLFVVFFIFV